MSGSIALSSAASERDRGACARSRRRLSRTRRPSGATMWTSVPSRRADELSPDLCSGRADDPSSPSWSGLYVSATGQPRSRVASTSARAPARALPSSTTRSAARCGSGVSIRRRSVVGTSDSWRHARSSCAARTPPPADRSRAAGRRSRLRSPAQHDGEAADVVQRAARASDRRPSGPGRAPPAPARGMVVCGSARRRAGDPSCSDVKTTVYGASEVDRRRRRCAPTARSGSLRRAPRRRV